MAIKFRYELGSIPVINGPEGQQEILSPGMDETSAEPQHSLAGSSFAQASVTSRQYYHPCIAQV